MAQRPSLPAIRSDVFRALPVDPSKINLNPKLAIPTIREIVTHPETCWMVIRVDTRTLKQIFEQYVFALAAIPALSGLIGYSVFSNIPFVKILEIAIGGYMASIGFMFAAVFLASGTAKMFDGEISQDQSGKLVVFSLMPYFAAGLFLLIPLVAPLALLGSLSFYAFFTGVKSMTRLPAAKRLMYCLINVVTWVVVADLIRTCLFFRLH